MLAPGRERMDSVSRSLAVQLPDVPREDWTSFLKQFEAKYPARFYLFRDNGKEIAGESVTLPTALLDRLRRLGGPRHNRGIDPPPDFEGGPDRGPGPLGPPPDHFGPPRSVLNHPPREAPLVILRAGTQYWAAVRIPVWERDRDDAMRSFLIWRFNKLWTNSFFFDYNPWLIGISIVLLVSAVCWLPLIRGLTSAISTLTKATHQIASGAFDVKLRIPRRDELGRLSESISQMAERLAGYVNGQKRFLGDVAHELSSPIARMQMAIGVLENRADRGDAAYVADVRDELEEMSALVNELLSFSKAQLSGNDIELTPVSVAALVARVVTRESPDRAAVRIAIDEGLQVMGNPEFLQRAVANVIRNAIRYAGHAGPIEVTASQIDDRVQIKVIDSGPGIPEAELENVFRAFYRPEFARTRQTGGTGLGLAIVRDCIEACKGGVSCSNRAPHGLEVIIDLPAAARSAVRPSLTRPILQA